VRGGDLNYWLFWVLGTLLIAAGVAVTWWGLFGDRARGRRRCPRCWYDLSHSPGRTCPECGYQADKERRLYRSRRRLLPALVAALVTSLVATWAIERVQQRGWLSLLPTRVILVGLPVVGGAHGDLTTELSTRIGRGLLEDGHYRALVNRCLRGDRSARPVTAPWERKYGNLLDQCRGAVPEDIDLDGELLALPARVELRSDRPWPADAPVCLNLELRHWWTLGTACRVNLTPRWQGAEPITLLQTGVRRRSRPYPLVIDDPPDSASLESDVVLLEFDVVLERRLPDPGATWQRIQELSISAPVSIEGVLTDVLQPQEHEDIDDAVMSALGYGVVKWTSGRSPVRVRFDPRHTYGMSLQDTAIGVSVELLRDGIIARRLDLWWPARPFADPEESSWLVVYEDDAVLMEASGDDGRWQMRVRGDPGLALRAGDASSYWAGEFTVPLVVSEVQTPAPLKDWWVESE
jgi:hypothetical protein